MVLLRVLMNICVCISCVIFSTQSFSQNRIVITQGLMEPLKIAILPFSFDHLMNEKVAQKIRKVLETDLERSGLFHVVNKEKLTSNPDSVYTKPQFSKWVKMDVQALLVAHFLRDQNGQIRLEYRLWDVVSQIELMGQALSGADASWRRIAHKVADTVYERLTGEKGYFDTRIAYIEETGRGSGKKTRLAIMDQDGENHNYITDGKYLVFSPRFSPDNSQIMYLVFRGSQPRVYLHDIYSGYISILGDFPGMTFAPRFSPDGKSVVMSHALDGNTEIYSMNLKTRQVKRLTRNMNIDVSPSYSPDGKFIVFQSDRSGSPQLYVMRSDGRNIKRISFGNGAYYAPVWSPRGDLIVFISQKKGRFYIGVMKKDGSGERLLANSYHVDTPTWSANGRVILFSKKTIYPNRPDHLRIYSIDLTGYNERELKTRHDASDPAWSSLMK